MSFLPGSSSQAAILPPEVLILIFELATYNSIRDIGYLTDLSPFESFYAAERNAQDNVSLLTKHSLALTCSLFRRMTIKFLYEDVQIRHGVKTLLKALQDSRAGSTDCVGFGKFVKRVILRPDMNDVAAEDVPRILSLCPNLQVLCRPPAATGSDSLNNSSGSKLTLDELKFPHLLRIDWGNSLTEEATASNRAPHFIWHSPTLRVLTLTSDNFFPPHLDVRAEDREEREILVNLPQLHTLRLRSCDALGDPDEFWFSVQLPSLRRIVLERPLALYALHAGCLAFYGPQIKTFELGRFKRFLRIDAISIALGYCPNVESLLFPVFTTMSPAKNALDAPRTEWLQYRVKHIGLNANMEEGFDRQVSRTWVWVQLDDLVDALFGECTRFAALEHITLYGNEWRELVHDEAFELIAKAIHSSKVRVDCEDRVTMALVQDMLDY